MKQKKTKTEIFKSENPDLALRLVMEHYGDEIPTSTSKNVKCPFHNDNNPSFNIKNGMFKCFSECGAHGDAFEYIKLKEGCGFQDALTIAGEIFNTKEEKAKGKSKTDLLNDYIQKTFKTFSGDESYKYEEHYVYKDENKKSVFIKIKFRNEENKKMFVMANLVDDGKVYRLDTNSEKINIFYNTHLIADAINEKKKIFIVEGEKDANTLTKLGFVAISCRNTKSLTNEMIDSLIGANIVVVPDMDSVGIEHERVLTECLLNKANSFKVLKLYELRKHNKKDVSDFVEILKDKGECNDSIARRIETMLSGCLDLKNLFELQQDRKGIKKTKFEYDKETGETIITPIYLTNFRIREARICVNSDRDKEYIEIVTERYKYHTSEKPSVKTIRGEVKNILLDIKSFSQELGFGLSFYGNGKDFITFKEWIDRFFLVEEKYEYSRVGIREDILIDGVEQKCLITQSGALMLDGSFNPEIRAVSEYSVIDLKDRKLLSKEDAEDLLEHMFRFTTQRNALNIWGSLVSGMLNPYYGESSQNPHILHIWGASGTGKSFSLERIIIPVLNTDAALSFETTTPHGLKLAFDETNIITLMDEVKPSQSAGGRLKTLSGAIRELTGSTKGLKGRKDQGANQTSYNSTLIMVGEEDIKETAVKNRSNQVVYTDTTTTAEHIKHGEKLMTVKYREKLKDLGFTLYLEILQNWNAERIDEVKEYVLEKYPLNSNIKIRERGTYINTVMGLLILEDVLRKATGNNKLSIVDNAVKHIEENLFENVLEGGEASKQNYEQWLELFEELVSTSDYTYLLEPGIHFRKVIEGGTECLAIAFTDAYNKTYERSAKLGQKLESNRTIKSLLAGSKYAHEIKTKKYKFKTTAFGSQKTKDALVLKMSMLEELGMINTVEIARKDYEDRK